MEGIGTLVVWRKTLNGTPICTLADIMFFGFQSKIFGKDLQKNELNVW